VEERAELLIELGERRRLGVVDQSGILTELNVAQDI
jgi:hypothetical protein